MTRPAPRPRPRCANCGEPVVRMGRLWMHDGRYLRPTCIVESRETGTVAEPRKETA